MLNYIFFFAGVLTTLAIVAIIKRYSNKVRSKSNLVSQSIVFEELMNFFPEITKTFNYKFTQMDSYESNKSFKYIEMPDKKVYWLDRNNIYYADIGKDGNFKMEDGKRTNMKDLSEQEVTRVLFIYNNLKSEY